MRPRQVALQPPARTTEVTMLDRAPLNGPGWNAAAEVTAVTEAPPEGCHLCGAIAWAPLPDPRLAHLKSCGDCGLVRVREMPALHDLHGLYGPSYYASPESHIVGYENYEADRHNIVRTARRRLRLIERYHPTPGRLLDVGCALGFFMDAAREHGWQPTGVDLSSYAVRLAQDSGAGDAYCGELVDIGFADGSFDVVTLWDVIEHMRDPLGQLRECHRVLQDGGLLLLSTPDLGSLMARLTGARWMGFKLADEHLYYFSRRTIAQLLERAGFETIDAFHVGKHVTLAFFAKRLTIYLPRLASLTAGIFRLLRLEERSVYVNPHDIVFVVARKQGG